DKARVVVKEMADAAALNLVDKHLVTDQLVLYVGYDVERMADSTKYDSIHIDYYGRAVPKPAHGSANLGRHTSSSKMLIEAATRLFDQIVNPKLMIRRLNLTTSHVISEDNMEEKHEAVQLDLFTDYKALEEKQRQEEQQLKKERKIQETMLDIKRRFGKNAILRGTNFEEGATARERNQQIGGHKA
ncbi:MAG: DNA methylase, partial [Bacteroidaceae bacterium]|nr:DNA methylase [Bacteroidaceae bacterium]